MRGHFTNRDPDAGRLPMTRLPAYSQTIARCVASTIVGVVLVAAGCTDGQGRLGGTETGGTTGDTAAGGTDTDPGGPSPSDTATEPDISVPATEDPSTNPADNPQCVDEDGDGYFAQCPQGKDCHDGQAGINPDAEETCGDKVDNDCSGGRDNGCSCDTDGASRPCYPGPAGTAGQGGCRTGEQTCANGTWSECQDFTLPAAEICDGDDDDCDGKVDEKVSNACGRCGKVTAEEKCSNGLDDNCDGRVDEKCQCGPKNECYTGPPQTLGTGACQAGSRECIGEGWGPCKGSVTPTSESCGDGIDNDCDGEKDEGCSCDEAAEVCDGIDNDCDDKVDEGCTPCLSQGGKKPWQIHKGEGPQCWPKKFDKNGARAEYDFASIPPKDDAGWKPEPDNFISFDERSTMCGKSGQPNKCECR
ncbi:MAG: MopE-related protein, partial [Bradymonadaceae bacterium]